MVPYHVIQKQIGKGLGNDNVLEAYECNNLCLVEKLPMLYALELNKDYLVT